MENIMSFQYSFFKFFLLTFLVSGYHVKCFSSEKEKTFAAIIKHAVFLEKGHKNYTVFQDNDFKIIKVTNLNKSGEGSLSWAIKQKGPRIVVFEVGGVIDMEREDIRFDEPYLFVAGQTAPEPGITIIKTEITVYAHDVIFQHIAIRTGDADLPKSSKWEKDALNTDKAYNAVMDHCSFTWATDENLSAGGPGQLGWKKTSKSITFSNNIISEGLYESTHVKGIHSMGTLVHDYVKNIAIVGNLYSQNNERNPFLKPNVRAFIANNLIYNTKNRAIHSSWPVEEYVNAPDSLRRARITSIGNVVIPGVDTPDELCVMQGPLKVYQRDNAYIENILSKENLEHKVLCPEIEILAKSPIWSDKYRLIKAKDVPANVLKNAGSRPKYRNAIDQRIVNDVINKTGKLINSQNEVEGYPNYPQTNRTLQIPEKNIEQWLEKLSEQLIK